MRFQRRGRRQKPDGYGNQRGDNGNEAVLLQWITRLSMPTAEPSRSPAVYRLAYEKLSPSQQKNLIDKIVNQILEAHSDIVTRTLRSLCRISLDLGQKVEVCYRQQLLSR